MNLGSVYLILSLQVVKVFFNLLFRLLKAIYGSEKVEDVERWLGKGLYWNSYLTVIQGAYVEITLSALTGFTPPGNQFLYAKKPCQKEKLTPRGSKAYTPGNTFV